MTEKDFPELSSGIIDIVEPKRLVASQIKACHEINLSDAWVNNPLWKKGDAEDEKRMSPTNLFGKMITDKWRVVTICWKRDDGPTNFGNAPAINHILVAVLVKTD